MANSWQRMTLVGHLGADPEVRYTPGGDAVCNMRVATSEQWKDKAGAKQERTEWHRIVVWGKQGETCGEFLAKGRMVLVEGRLQTRKWEKDGQDHYSTEVVADRVVFLGGGKGESAGAGGSRGGDDDADFGERPAE